MTWPASRCRSDEHAFSSGRRKSARMRDAMLGGLELGVVGGVACEAVGAGGQGERGGEEDGVPD